MKILLFGHSSSPGGGERALRRLVQLLHPRHDVLMVLPAVNSPEGEHYKALGIRCVELNVPIALPAAQNAFLSWLRFDWDRMVKVLGGENCDIAISNTITILHGNLLAHRLRIPHIPYVHEYLEDPELLPVGLTRDFYLELATQGAAGLMGCSEMSLSQFAPKATQPRLCLPPFDYALHPVARPRPATAERVIQVIGTMSHRKNGVFATAVAKALQGLGVPVRLDFIGTKNNATAKLEQILRKRNITCRMLPHQTDPYAVNADVQAITLVCSTSEPYGLTIPESLRLGVPAIASRCGGPSEILPPEWLFGIDDVDACTRTLVAIWSDYEGACEQAHAAYRARQAANDPDAMAQALESLLERARVKQPGPDSDIEHLFRAVQLAARIPIGREQIADSILSVARDDGLAITGNELRAAIDEERARPGTAVTSDIKRFDAVPHAMSEGMDRLYRRGIGMAVELAATFDGPERLQMAAFIVCRLWQRAQASAERLSVLALGDGAGVDSIRLAHAGFDVDYMDYDGSSMARIAAKNFAACAASASMQKPPSMITRTGHQYDAVVCLEVLEHVPDPDSFIATIAGHLKTDGLLFVSECFNGIESRWPTHLYANERLAGLLPFLMDPLFELEAVNTRPFAKPYVFRRRGPGDTGSAMRLLRRREVLRDLIRHQTNIGL